VSMHVSRNYRVVIQLILLAVHYQVQILQLWCILTFKLHVLLYWMYMR
jgi:hypothetical protein